jgi:hypothetical protein
MIRHVAFHERWNINIVTDMRSGPVDIGLRMLEENTTVGRRVEARNVVIRSIRDTSFLRLRMKSIHVTNQARHAMCRPPCGRKLLCVFEFTSGVSRSMFKILSQVSVTIDGVWIGNWIY